MSESAWFQASSVLLGQGPIALTADRTDRALKEPHSTQELRKCLLNERAILLNLITDGAPAVFTLPPWHPIAFEIKASPSCRRPPPPPACSELCTPRPGRHQSHHLPPWPPDSSPQLQARTPDLQSLGPFTSQPLGTRCGMSFWCLPRTFLLTLHDLAGEPPPLGSWPWVPQLTWPPVLRGHVVMMSVSARSC